MNISFWRMARRVTLTRFGALSRARRFRPAVVRTPAVQVTMVLISSFLIGLAISLFRHADLGLPPYDVLVSALSQRSGMSFGQSGWALAVLFYAIAAIAGQRPKLIGGLWVFANGLMIDTLFPLFQAPESLGGRVGFAAMAIVTLAGAVAVIAHGAETGGAFELLTRAAEQRGIGPRRFRTGLEVGILAIGVVAGGVYGPATVMHALAISAAIGFTMQGLADLRAGRELRLTTAQ